MKKLMLAVLSVALLSVPCFAKYVKGYTKKDGTYVSGHYKTESNKTVTDNYSYKDNYNPYTGEKGKNKNIHDKTSEYYTGY
jgi:hypothetical protein